MISTHSPLRFARWLLTLVFLLHVSAAQGQTHELPYDLRVDMPVTVFAAAGWVGTEFLKGHFAQQDCAWCDRDPDGTDGLNGLDASVRSALKWSDTGAANTASNITGFAVMPLGALGIEALAASHEDRLADFPVDVLLIAEATSIAAVLNQVVKFSAGRERPFVHALPPELKNRTADPSDNNTSFYSGHTNLVFALAVSSGTVATMRGYRWAPWVWGGGLAVAATTGYLRIAADRHYFTDVLTGAVVGGAVGFAVPYLLHRPLGGKTPVLTAAPVPGGAALAASYVW